MDAGRRTVELLERRPELEGAIETVLEVDAENDSWTFEDVPVDSGTFGEIVAADIVEDDGEGYRVAEPDLVRRALRGEVVDEDDSSGELATAERLRSRLVAVDRSVVAMLAVTLAFLVIVRSFVAGSVFRGEHVVLSGNDPYFYRYWVEGILEGGGVDWASLGELPTRVANGEPLLVAALGFVSGLFGGTGAAGHVMAAYPVVAALVAALALYYLALRLTDDRRVGFAAVALLAVIPGHAFRTSVGYADHHAFDYVWLVLTALALVVLLDRSDSGSVPDWHSAALAAVLGVLVATQTLAWEGGPLLLLPIAVIVVGHALLAVRDERSPLSKLIAPTAGLWLGGILTLGAHVLFGWHEPIIAGVPALLAAGTTGVAALGEGVHRTGRSVADLVGLQVAAGLAAVGAAWVALPGVGNSVFRALGRATIEGRTSEARALFDAASLGFFVTLGPIVLFASLAVMVWATGRLVRGGDRLLVPCAYGWFFFGLTLFQIRFIGEFAAFAALFAGLGLVWLAARVDLTTPPGPFVEGSLTSWRPGRPRPRTVGYVLALFVLIGGIGLVQSAIKVDQIAVGDDAYRTAAWMEDYAEERGWETVGESYVFSRWDRTRLFNYFVNGESRGYGYALTSFEDFLARTDPEVAYDSLRPRVAFVVTRPRSVDPPTVHSLLHDRYGSRDGRFPGSGHFRTVFVSDGETFKVSRPVAGAVLSGATAPNETVRASTSVSIPRASFTYERRITANATGGFDLRVAYPGRYDVTYGGETREVTVTNGAVEGGEPVPV